MKIPKTAAEKRPRGRPQAQLITGWRVMRVRAILIDLMTRTLLSADDVSDLLKNALRARAPSGTVIEMDLAIASAAESRPMNADRWAIYAIFVDAIKPAIEVVCSRAWREVEASDADLRDRVTKMPLPAAYNPKQQRLRRQAAVYMPRYHRERMRVYLRAIRELARTIFAERLRQDRPTFLQAVEQIMTSANSAANWKQEQLWERRLKQAFDLWRATRRSSLNLASRSQLGDREITSAEFAVHSRLLGFDPHAESLSREAIRRYKTALKTKGGLNGDL